MPELPDLTLFAESLEAAVLNRRIRAAEYHRRKRLNVDTKVLHVALQDRSITSIKRRGKALLFELDSGDRLLVHLMLSGGFRITSGGEEVPAAVLTLSFEDGRSLVLFDPRGLATVTWNPGPDEQGVDALELTREKLQALIRRKPKATIKELLLDQSLVTGIGNAYSDEILWQARISPRSTAGKIPEEAVAELQVAIGKVLKEATGYLRKEHPGMMSGEAREHLAVHRPKAKNAPTGAAIFVGEVASKKTYYTDEQILYQ